MTRKAAITFQGFPGAVDLCRVVCFTLLPSSVPTVTQLAQGTSLIFLDLHYVIFTIFNTFKVHVHYTY